MTTRNFHPGAVVRYGNDPTLYIRNLDGTWTRVYIGYRDLPAYSQVSRDTDASLGLSIERGYAELVHESQPPRSASRSTCCCACTHHDSR